MKITKKSQQLSLSTVIIAALLLLVLAVIIYIFSTRSGDFNKGVGEVAGCKEEFCVDNKDDCKKIENRPVAVPSDCRESDEVSYCCKPLG
ncbi:MAG: hypothetical protein ACQER9_00055 [Nanobdellota archaeon]